VPDQTSWPGVAVTGPYADQIGQLLSDLDPIADDRLVATLDQAAQAAAIDLSTGVVPTVLTGRITLPDELAGPDILVSVNGTVSGAGFTVRDSGDVFTFSALVPEEVYNLGSNDVQILAPGPDGRLHVAESGTVQATELRDGNGEHLLIVAPGQRKVVIDAATIDGGNLRVKGWSADTGEKVPAESMLIFFGDQLAYEGPPNLERSDVPQWFDSEDLRLSGFDILIPVSDIPAEAERVTIVGKFSADAVLGYATIGGAS
jgi:hypothetical protein